MCEKQVVRTVFCLDCDKKKSPSTASKPQFPTRSRVMPAAMFARAHCCDRPASLLYLTSVKELMFVCCTGQVK